MKRLKNIVSLIPKAALVALATFAAWGEAADQDYIGAANWLTFGAATLVTAAIYQRTQTKTSIVVYISAYTLSLAAFLGIILRQTQLPEMWLYAGLLGVWTALTVWFARAVFRAKPVSESNSSDLAAP